MARVPQGTRTERGVEQQGVGRGGTAQTTAGDIRIPGVQRDPGLSVNPRQFGSQVGQAMQGLGQSIGDLAMVQRQVAERRQEAEDSIFLTRARSTLNQRLYETTLNTQNEVDNFGNFFETVTPKYQETRGAVLTELQGEFNPSEEALQRYEAIAEGLVGDYGIKAITFENNQKVAKYRDDLDLEVNRLAESVLTNGDLETGLAALNDTLAGFRGVMPPDEFRGVSRVAKAQLSSAYLEGIIRTNPGGAAAVMDHGLGRGGGEGSIIGAIIAQESNGNPDAVSPAGAVGLMQVMPDTAREIARELGDKAFPHDGSNQEVSAYLKDPETNTRYGKHYFQKMLRRYGGDVEAALVAYNGGPGRADNWLKAGRDDKVLPDETRKYYKKVLDRVDGASGDVLDLAFKNLQIGEQLRFVDRAERANNVRIKQFERAFGDHIANIENFGAGLEGFNVNEAQRFLDPEQFAEVERAVEQAHQNHEAIRTIRYGPMGEAVAAVQDAAPVPGTEGVEDQIARQQRFARMLRDRAEAMRDDPAGYAQEGFPDVAEAYGEAFQSGEPEAFQRAIDLSLEAQDRLDVPAHRQRVLPESYVAELKQRLRLGDAVAFELVDNFTAEHPIRFSPGSDMTKIMDEFRGYTRLGYSAAEAARRASRSDAERADMAAFGADVSKELKDISDADVLNALDTGNFFFTPEISDARRGRLRNDFETAYREARAEGVGRRDAVEVAAARLDRIWGVSVVNGEEDVMRFPPERYYPEGADGHGYIREQAVADITGLTGGEPIQLRFMSDLITEGDIKAGQPPRYRLFYVDADGVPQQMPGYFRADPASATEALTEERRLRFEGRAEEAEELRRQREEVLERFRTEEQGLALPGATE